MLCLRNDMSGGTGLVARDRAPCSAPRLILLPAGQIRWTASLLQVLNSWPGDPHITHVPPDALPPPYLLQFRSPQGGSHLALLALTQVRCAQARGLCAHHPRLAALFATQFPLRNTQLD